jgi:hypothetical protein
MPGTLQSDTRRPAHRSALAAAEVTQHGASHPRTGWALSGFVGLFLLFDGAARVAGLAPYVEGTVRFGYDASLAPWIGASLVLSTLLYLLPRTTVLGAVLLAGYLGGAAATHAREQDPWFLFPILLAVVAWAGVWAREPRLRALLPLRR